MLFPAQSVDYKSFDSSKFCFLFGGDVVHIREVGEVAEAKTYREETIGMATYNGEYLDARNIESMLGIKGVEFDFWDTSILIFCEGVVEVSLYSRYCWLVAVDVHCMNGLWVVHEVECPYVVNASRMVFMLVSEQYGINVSHPFAKHLVAEIGSGVDNNALILPLQHCRCT